MDKVLLKYTEYNEPHESRTNGDIVDVSIYHWREFFSSNCYFQMLNKKELKSCESPEPEQTGYDQMQNKFPKISNSDFDQLLKNQSMQESTVNMVSIFKMIVWSNWLMSFSSDLNPLWYEPPHIDEQLSDKRTVADSCKQFICSWQF